MEKLFGIEINNLLFGLSGILLAIFLILAFAAWRNPVLFKMGVRNITRRPAQTFLILLGLMLATLLFSSTLATGDTMNYSVEKSAIETIGQVDLVIQPKKNSGTGESAMDVNEAILLKNKDLNRVKELFHNYENVDGISPFVNTQVPAQSPKNKRNLPSLGLAGLDESYTKQFGKLSDSQGKELKLSDLGKNEVYINEKTADKLEVKAGDKINIFTSASQYAIEVKGVIAKGAVPSYGPSAVLAIEQAQKLLDMPAGYSSILISGKGNETSGVEHSAAIFKKVKKLFNGTPFEVEQTKKDMLEQAKQQANMFTTIFLVFGQFSMMAGIMLIFLIFVMLAAERKVELGVMRAIGLQRRDLLKIFTFEGAVYALLSAVIGAVLGIFVGMGMIKVITAAIGQIEEFPLTFHFTAKSFVIAYSMGVIATFFIVVLSAWRAGKINIVRAVRDLPEPAKAKKGLKRLIILLVVLVIGVMMMSGGVQGKQTAPFMMGLSLLLAAIPLLATWIRLPERAAYSIAGLGITIAWLLPETTIASLVPGFDTFSGGIEMFFISGIAIITGAIWVIMYNSDILLAFVTFAFGRLKGLPPILRIAVNYPMKNRVRTGLALAMFSLVMFTIIFMSSLLGSFGAVYDDVDRFSGSYDIRGATGFSNPVEQIERTLGDKGDIKHSDIKALGTFSIAPAAFKQERVKSKKWADHIVYGIDSGYAKSTSYKMTLKSSKYRSDRDVWDALNREPNTAVVHASLVPAKTSYSMGEQEPPFRMSGFFREDKKLPDVYLEAKNPMTGKIEKLKIIGVIELSSIYLQSGIVTSQKTVNKMMGTKVPATTFWFKFKESVDIEKANKVLAKVFYKNGMETTILSEDIGALMRVNLMMNRLLQGFMGLGLVVGIAALGVIASRSVVERRRQIGMLRAIGFQRSMVQSAFLLESSFVSLLGIVVGAALALILAHNVSREMAADMPGMVYVIPWVEVLAISGVSYLIAMIATYLPARQASKVFPAEALRYE